MIKKKLNKRIIIIAVGIILLAAGASYAVYAAGVVFFGGASAQTVVTFTAVGTTSWTVPEGITSVEVLVVGGGGGGSVSSNGGAGGGAGGLIYNSSYTVIPGNSYSITVGSGGSGHVGRGNGTSGNNSIFDSLTATGGGVGGGTGIINGGVGGSGGGGAYPGSGGTGTNGQGNSGGNGGYYLSLPLPADSGGGGGGAGGAGENGKGNSGGGGKGGDGLSYSISGVVTYYAGGGAGATNDMDVRALGGNGGGGTGGTPATKNGNDGVANTGGGGGGGNGGGGNSGAGGSGIVIIRYGKSKIAASSIQKGLVGHWLLDGDGYNANTGRITDKTPNENHGTNYGATLTADRNGQSNGAMSFDGTDKRITFNASNLGLNRSQTLVGWVKANGASPGPHQTMVATDGNYLSGFKLMSYYHANVVKAWIADGTNSYTSVANVNVNDGLWHFVAATYDYTSGYATIYVDSVKYTPSYIGSFNIPVAVDAGRIGQEYHGSGSYSLNGSISDVRIYNRALSQDEIGILYNTYKPKVTAGSLQQGLVFDMPLTSSYIKTVTAGSQIMTDRTPYSNDGQNNGATVGSDSTSFNGVNNYVVIPHSANLKPASRITISAWVKPSVLGSYYEIYRKEDGADRHLLSFQAGSILSFGISTGGAYTELDVNIVDADWLNKWSYVAATYDGVNKKIYRNGVEIGNEARTGAIGTTGTALAYIGSSSGGELFNGSISAVKIYNRALSPQEVESLYVQGATNLGGVKTHRVSCKEILNAGESTGDGFYTIKPNSGGLSFQAYCDMTTDGGGWTLVLLNNKGLTSPTPAWSDALNSVNTTGSINTNLTSFDLFLGVSYWKNLGAKMRLQIGSSPSSLTNKAIYSGFSFAGNYALTMSGETIMVGSGSPGMFNYHAANHFNLTTSDRDNDVYAPINCSVSYGGAPWWYGDCWSGSFWGFSTLEGPRWDGSAGGDSQWGSIWIGQ